MGFQRFTREKWYHPRHVQQQGAKRRGRETISSRYRHLLHLTPGSPKLSFLWIQTQPNLLLHLSLALSPPHKQGRALLINFVSSSSSGEPRETRLNKHGRRWSSVASSSSIFSFFTLLLARFFWISCFFVSSFIQAFLHTLCMCPFYTSLSIKKNWSFWRWVLLDGSVFVFKIY